MKTIKYLSILIVVGFLSVIVLYFSSIRKINAKVYSITDNIVIFQDICGNLWSWEDTEEIFRKNDEVILYINDKTTDFLKDDEIIKIILREE